MSLPFLAKNLPGIVHSNPTAVAGESRPRD
jgi:hypothetical protein